VELVGHAALWERPRMAKVTGIGGVFFKSRSDHKALAAWYARHLGLALEEWGGAILKWPDDQADDRGLTVWHVAARDSDWFSPSDARALRAKQRLSFLREEGIANFHRPDETTP